jgi:hypothetical protein
LQGVAPPAIAVHKKHNNQTAEVKAFALLLRQKQQNMEEHTWFRHTNRVKTGGAQWCSG